MSVKEIAIDHWNSPTTCTNDEVNNGCFDMKLLPKKKDIPEEFWTGHSPWTGALFQWKCLHRYSPYFFKAREGVDFEQAMRHIITILRTKIGTGHKAEHYKEAVLSFLLSKWFELPDLYKQREAFEKLRVGK